MRRAFIFLAVLMLFSASSAFGQIRQDADLSSLRVQLGDSMVPINFFPVLRGPLPGEHPVTVSPLAPSTGGKRRAVRHPAIEPAPFVIALSNVVLEGGNNAVISQFEYVPVGTYVETRIWATGESVPVVYIPRTINNPGPPDDSSLWWGVAYKGPIPLDWEYAELLVTEPGRPTKRAFVNFSAGGGSGPARVATLDAGGGVHLDGFYQHRPVVVAPLALTSAMKSVGADYNYFRLDESDVKQGRVATVGMVLTVCKTVEVFGVGVTDLNNRQCITGTLEAQEK